MADQSVHTFDFGLVVALSNGPSLVAGLRVQVSEPLLDTAERVAAYLQSEPGAISAALHEGPSVLPLYSDSEGNLRPEDLEGNEIDELFAPWTGSRASVNRDGSVVVELSVEQLRGGEKRMVRLGCNLGTAEDLRVMIRESEARERLQALAKPRLGM